MKRPSTPGRPKSARGASPVSRIGAADKRLKNTKNRSSKSRPSAALKVLGQLRKSNQAVRADFAKRSTFARTLIRSVIAAVIALALLVGVAVFSPLLAVERILVRGNHSISEKSISTALKSQLGKPLPQVNSADVASLLKPFKRIESFTLISAPPNTLVVRIVERTPISIIYVGDNFYFFDPAGVNLGKANDTSKLPVLDIKGAPGKSENFKIAISVLLALPAKLLPRIALVSAKSLDNVTFRLRGYAAQKVIWGDSDNAILKSRVLAALIKNQSPNDRVTYDVSSPTAPTVRYQ